MSSEKEMRSYLSRLKKNLEELENNVRQWEEIFNELQIRHNAWCYIARKLWDDEVGQEIEDLNEWWEKQCKIESRWHQTAID